MPELRIDVHDALEGFFLRQRLDDFGRADIVSPDGLANWQVTLDLEDTDLGQVLTLVQRWFEEEDVACAVVQLDGHAYALDR